MWWFCFSLLRFPVGLLQAQKIFYPTELIAVDVFLHDNLSPLGVISWTTIIWCQAPALQHFVEILQCMSLSSRSRSLDQRDYLSVTIRRLIPRNKFRRKIRFFCRHISRSKKTFFKKHEEVLILVLPEVFNTVYHVTSFSSLEGSLVVTPV